RYHGNSPKTALAGTICTPEQSENQKERYRYDGDKRAYGGREGSEGGRKGGREEGVMDRWKRNRERKVRTKDKESENKVWQTGKYDNLFVNL
ncbi:MAG: hypothetical protein J6W74_03215, partial [Bacteroidales bacterium]|nr:hypothetical protein [Bacteroidales bacterium]